LTQPEPTYLSFTDNHLLPALFGEQDRYLHMIEKALKVSAVSRGGNVALTGVPAAVKHARKVLETLYHKLEKGIEIGTKEVEAALRMVNDDLAEPQGTLLDKNNRVEIRTRKKTVTPHSHKQTDYINMLYEHEVVFAIGPAGTGKTYIAVAVAVAMFVAGKVDRIVLTRPAVEAGEKLGYLPGDLKEKIDPYLRPLYDAMHDMLPGEKVNEYMANNVIEIAPLAYMRGRTLSNAFVILDEAQNTTPTQMKMFLTRLGENSRMVITGDLSQTDLPSNITSGLKEAAQRLSDVEGIGFLRFSDADVVRHPLVAAIIRAYEAHEKKGR
jgi:phosphate starvation-inducible PhoH-like protein